MGLLDLSNCVFEIRLAGRFRLIGPDKEEIIVSRSRVQALIVLLVSDEQMTRSRHWLQDKLWSERTPEKSANSLRQTLHQMRKCFGEDSAIVSANRSTISLDRSKIHLNHDGAGEFLEGLDVRDQEFEFWLLEERLRRSADTTESEASPLAAPEQRRHVHRSSRGLALDCANDPYSKLGQFELFFSDTVFKSIREVLDFDPVDPHGPVANVRDVITLGIQAHHDTHGRVALRLAVYQGPRQGACWSDTATGDMTPASSMLAPEFLNLSCRVSAILSEQLCRPGSNIAMENDANFYAAAGIRQMYSLLPGGLEKARSLLGQAEDIQYRGLFDALRAQLAVIEFVESGGGNREVHSEMADEFCAKALASESTNSVVLSAVAHSRLVFDQDYEAAAELSRLGVLSNPANPMAWSAWANILLNTGKLEDAAKAAQTALRLSKDTYFRYWTEFQYATTAASLSQSGTAIKHAERARALNPRYRPALRYLVGLYANAENFDAARTAMSRLQKQEKDTTVDRIVNDASYPVSMMRSAGLIIPEKLREVS